MYNEEWEEQFELIDTYQHLLNVKEEDFIYGEYGIKKMIESNKELSFRQSKWLRDIYHRIQGLIG